MILYPFCLFAFPLRMLDKVRPYFEIAPLLFMLIFQRSQNVFTHQLTEY
jgi:hypothetical protein